MKKQTDEIARLENYAIWFRRETLRRWAEYLDKQIKKSGIVSNQSQIELETAKYGKRFTVSRQRISQIQAAKNPDAVMKDHSLMNVETVIGIAAALDLPLEQASESRPPGRDSLRPYGAALVSTISAAPSGCLEVDW